MSKSDWPANLMQKLYAMHLAWQTNDWLAFATSFDQNVTMTSPYAEGNTLHGIDAVVQHFIERKEVSPRRQLLDVLIGEDAFTVLMRDEVGYKAIRVVPNLQRTTIIHLDVSFSVKGL